VRWDGIQNHPRFCLIGGMRQFYFFLFEEKERDGMDDTFERHLSCSISSSVSHGSALVLIPSNTMSADLLGKERQESSMAQV
jgi:hypothetical protein